MSSSFDGVLERSNDILTLPLASVLGHPFLTVLPESFTSNSQSIARHETDLDQVCNDTCNQ